MFRYSAHSSRRPTHPLIGKELITQQEEHPVKGVINYI